MAHLSREPLLGVVLKDEKIKLIEVESTTGNQFRINKIVESKLDFPFSINNIREEKYFSEYADELHSLINRHGFSSRRAAFSISDNLVFIKKYPYDNDLQSEELVDQVDWETKQFLFSIDDEYIIDFQKLVFSKSSSMSEMIIVAVRESAINYIKKIFAKANIKLNYVDADIFAAIRAIEKNYECRKGELYALICIEQDGIQFTILNSGEFFSTHHEVLKTKSESSSLIMNDEIIKTISKELRRIILDNKLGEKIEDFNRIFLYGDLVQDDVLESLQNSYNVRIDRTNPFRRLRFAHNVSVDENIWSRPETFTVCVGAALR